MSDSAHKQVYIETFGCQMNQADTEVVLARLGTAGYRRCERSTDADLILYNTCSVRDNAEAKVRGRLDQLKRRKRERPELRIGIMGCMAQRLKEDLVSAHPHVDLVVGTDQFVHLPEMLDRLAETDRIVATDFGDFEHRDWGASRAEGVNAWVPIMRGCNYNCTYCIVPTTRGREKSRDPQMIEDEVRRLVDEGFVQVTLLGQTVDAYGKTIGDGSNLARLLRRLHPIAGLERIRFITSHPKDITDELLDTMAELPKVGRYLHVPAQHGSSRILRLMGRRYTRDDYLRFVERARTRMPDVHLQTDMIVGFPRETAEDHAASVSLMREVGFGGAYVFMYSPRPGTGAVNLGDDVPAEIKRVRCNDLLGLQLQIQEEAFKRHIGREVEVLFEGVSKSSDAHLQGRDRSNLNVVIPRLDADGQSRDDLIGRCVAVRIERSTNLTCYGEPVGVPA